MPELPEVETVRRTLKKHILNRKISKVDIYWDSIIGSNREKFIKEIQNKKIVDILRVGKWLLFDLESYYLLSHLRMEGKYFLKSEAEILNKHEHVVFHLDDITLRYHDTRKFGKMYLIEKDLLYSDSPLKNIGLEPFDEKLDLLYLKSKILKNKPIKSLLLEQEIIAGIGNIYADEILFLAKINPFIKGNSLTDENLLDIIKYSKEVLSKAIEMGGTTIRSYTSSLGVTGRFQQKLNVHQRSNQDCYLCHSKIVKTTIQGRGTYYCPSCQKEVK